MTVELAGLGDVLLLLWRHFCCIWSTRYAARPQFLPHDVVLGLPFFIGRPRLHLGLLCSLMPSIDWPRSLLRDCTGPNNRASSPVGGRGVRPTPETAGPGGNSGLFSTAARRFDRCRARAAAA